MNKKITADIVRKVWLNNTEWDDIADALNKQLEEPERPDYYWLKWGTQEEGCKVILKNGISTEAVYVGFTENNPFNFISVNSVTGIATKTPIEDVSPDFSRRGHWKVDSDNPLVEKPTGLSDNALVFCWFNNGEQSQYARNVDWPNAESFTILDPAQ